MIARLPLDPHSDAADKVTIVDLSPFKSYAPTR
jgi:hypothetical protein